MKEVMSYAFPFLRHGITQVAWVVRDLDESVQKFHELTGIGPWYFYRYGRPLLKSMKRFGKEADFAMRTAVANAGELRLELVQPLYGDTIFKEYVDNHGFGFVQHFGFAVDDMAEAVKHARAAGFTVTMEGSGYGVDGDGHFAYLDTERVFGITMELMERPKRRHAPEKVYPENGDGIIEVGGAESNS